MRRAEALTGNGGRCAACGVHVRPLRREDIPRLVARCYRDDPLGDAASRLEEELEAQHAGRGVTLVALEDGTPGAGITMECHGDVGWVHNVAAHDDLRGRGVVQRMFRALFRFSRRRGLKRVALHVRRGNMPAIRAYERAGFRFAGEDGMRGEQLRYECRFDADRRSGGESERPVVSGGRIHGGNQEPIAGV